MIFGWRLMVVLILAGVFTLAGLTMPVSAPAAVVDVPPCHAMQSAEPEDVNTADALNMGDCTLCSWGACCGGAIVVGFAYAPPLAPKVPMFMAQKKGEGLRPNPLWEPPRGIL